MLAILGVLSFLAITVYTLLNADLKMSKNHNGATQSMYQAEAAVALAKRAIELELERQTPLEEMIGEISITPPEGFTFDPVFSFQEVCPGKRYAFSVTGRSGLSETSLKVLVEQKQALPAGVFGVSAIAMSPNGDAYSFDSRTLNSPSRGDSTGEAVIGSNGHIELGTTTDLDGQILVGSDISETPASCVGCADAFLNYGGYQTPDPLGVGVGDLADIFIPLATDNSNGNESLIRPDDNQLIVPHAETAALTAGDYFLEGILLESGSNLRIDTTFGPVEIFLSGRLLAADGSQIHFDGSASDFRIYSNSDKSIQLANQNDFRGHIYAPYASVSILNKGSFAGGVWARDVTMTPDGDVFIDTALNEKFISNQLEIVGWKEVRN